MARDHKYAGPPVGAVLALVAALLLTQVASGKFPTQTST
jgi:hypothetical protein